MANEHGGYRRPANPAPEGSSGPGKHSRRTDGGPSVDNNKQAAQYISGMPYGEGAEVNAVANAVPLAAAGNPANNAAAAQPAMPISSPMPMPIGFNAPTERPNEPITSGVPVGPGSNNLSLPLDTAALKDKETSALILGLTAPIADREDATQATRNLVRRLRAQMGNIGGGMV